MRRDLVLVADMLRHARQAARAAAGVTVEQLDADPDRQSMVLWPLIVLGEAAAHVSDDYRRAHDDIPWRRIIGLRNVLIHDYSGVDMVAVADVLETHLPALIRQLESLGTGDSTE
jgi:uncharacterized protein with HEPN domain